ncbi:hypothetical protein [Streptomyces sp. NPDC059378]|uniref:hypothetical protein n=1 Tax=Streptomyces sp. NPDC059378 TaxID=3346815 RepID=UPI0036BF5A55
MARHDSPQTPTGRRVLVALATAGVALGAGAGAAAADSGPVLGAPRTHPGSVGPVDPQAGLNGLLGSVRYVTGPLSELKPNPLAGTGVDPLDNGVGTRLADFEPLSSKALTGPIAQAQSIGGMPVVGQVTGLLGG